MHKQQRKQNREQTQQRKREQQPEGRPQRMVGGDDEAVNKAVDK